MTDEISTYELSDARTLLCAARDAVKELRWHEERAEMRRAMCVMRARNYGPSARGWISDPTKRIDTLVDYEVAYEEHRTDLMRVVKNVDNMLSRYFGMDPRGASVLRLRFLQVLPWSDVAQTMGFGHPDDARRCADIALDRIDSEGLNVMSGKAKVTGAEDDEGEDGID